MLWNLARFRPESLDLNEAVYEFCGRKRKQNFCEIIVKKVTVSFLQTLNYQVVICPIYTALSRHVDISK